MRRYYLMLGCLFLACLSGCAEEEEQLLPYVPMNFHVFLPSHPELRAGMPKKVGQREYGYNKNGVIVVPDGYDSYVYEAFDATCTRDITKDAASINVDESGITATCPRCGTVYHIRSGGHSNDNGSRLQSYRATRTNDLILVTN